MSPAEARSLLRLSEVQLVKAWSQYRGEGKSKVGEARNALIGAHKRFNGCYVKVHGRIPPNFRVARDDGGESHLVVDDGPRLVDRGGGKPRTRILGTNEYLS